MVFKVEWSDYRGRRYMDFVYIIRKYLRVPFPVAVYSVCLDLPWPIWESEMFLRLSDIRIPVAAPDINKSEINCMGAVKSGMCNGPLYNSSVGDFPSPPAWKILVVNGYIRFGPYWEIFLPVFQYLTCGGWCRWWDLNFHFQGGIGIPASVYTDGSEKAVFVSIISIHCAIIEGNVWYDQSKIWHLRKHTSPLRWQ